MIRKLLMIVILLLTSCSSGNADEEYGKHTKVITGYAIDDSVETLCINNIEYILVNQGSNSAWIIVSVDKEGKPKVCNY